MKNKKTMKKIIYYVQEVDEILKLKLNLSFEQLGFYTAFKASYLFHAGKIPTNRLFEYCQVFEKRQKFKKWVESFCEIENGFFIFDDFEKELSRIKDKSEKNRINVSKRWNKGVDTKKEEKAPQPQKKAVIDDKFLELSEGLIFILENLLNKSLSSRKNAWAADIKKMIEIDLKDRTDPINDTKKAIQAVADNYGKDYFPIINSGKSLREKIDKIENYLKREKNKKKSSWDSF